MGKFYVTPKGVFEEYSDDLFEGTLKAEFPIPFTKEHDVFEVTEREVEEKLSIKFERMPLRLFQETLAFLEWCHKEKKSEGFVAHRYIDGVWENVVFPQWNSSGSVCYHPELLIEKSTRVVGDTHSHPPSYGSTHSHTDGLDERKNNGIFVVVKGFTPMSCDPEIIGCVRGRRFHLKAESLFDLSDYNPKPTFPEEWKDLVGSFPCKGCERKREAEKRQKDSNEKKEVLEYEKKFRLVPKPALEVWRTEIAKEKETLGQKLRKIWEDYRKKMPNHAWPRVLRCDNYGCHKFTSSPKCDECGKTIGQEAIITAFVDMVDEWQAVSENKEDLDVILQVLEEDAKKGPEPLAPFVPESHAPPVPASPPAPPALPAPAERKGPPHVLIIATEKECGKDCPYLDVPHKHAQSKEILQGVWKKIVDGKTRDDCTTTQKKCLYPESKVCDNGCVWSEALEGKSASAPSEPALPSCKVLSCKEAHHSFVTCDISKAIEDAARKCPSKSCETSAHSWATCEVKKLKIALLKSGDLLPRCTQETCERTGHNYLDCPIRIVREANLPPVSDSACTNEVCQRGNHYMSDCPIYKQRRTSSTSSAPHAYPETVVVGESAVCPDTCQFKGKPHRHETSKGEASAAPTAGYDEGWY